MAPAPSVLRVSSRNARFQQWEALLANRGKRHRRRYVAERGERGDHGPVRGRAAAHPRRAGQP